MYICMYVSTAHVELGGARRRGTGLGSRAGHLPISFQLLELGRVFSLCSDPVPTRYSHLLPGSLQPEHVDGP